MHLESKAVHEACEGKNTETLRFVRRTCTTLAERVSRMTHLESKAGGLNLLLAGHEDEDVPLGVPQVDGNGLLHSSLDIVLLGGLAEQGLNREGASRDLEDWHAAEEV